MEDPNYYEYDGKIYYELPARFKWSLTHYDGPMTAIVTYKDRVYYAKCHQSPFSHNTRYFWMYPISPTENLKEIAYQQWFREFFGLHCDFNQNNQRCRRPETWKEKLWEWTRPLKKKNRIWYAEKQKELKIDREQYTKREPVGFTTLYSWQEHQISLRDQG